MNIVRAIPIVKGIAKDYLSYFSKKDIQTGSIIKVPIRKKQSLALVVETESVKDLKASLKSSDFALKKVGNIPSQEFVSEGFMKAVYKIADFYGASLGSVLFSLLPQAVISKADQIRAPLENKKGKAGPIEKTILQADDDERFSLYRSLIREQFAKNTSVFFCVPTIEDAERLGNELKKGIEQYSAVFSSQTKKELVIKEWNKTITEKHPMVIIGTGQYISIPRKDIGVIVVEKENSGSFKSVSRPYLDMRLVAEYVAKEINASLILGDLIISTETMWRYKNNEFAEFSQIKLRVVSEAEEIVVDARKKIEEDKKDKSVEPNVLSEELLSLIKYSRENNEHALIFVNRKGAHPVTICHDCGSIVRCPICQGAVTIHESVETNIFTCHKCGHKRSAQETCSNCESWNLIPLGIGTEKVFKEIEKSFPDLKIFKMDSDNIKTHSKAKSVVESFYASPGSIMIGTEMCLTYLHEKIQNVAVVSVDSLLSIPDFRINERGFAILLRLKSLAKKYFLIETRDPENPLLRHVHNGNLSEFYREEIDERKKWNYPPFYRFLKISTVEKIEKAQEVFDLIIHKSPNYEAHTFTSSRKDLRGKKISNLLLRIPRQKWPDTNLVNILKNLPLSYSLKIDPENLLQ